MKPKIHFLGGAGTVTGVCYLIEADDKKILVDCGLLQGERDAEKKNHAPFDFDPKKIDAVIITHSHLDHVGRLPQLVKGGFKGKIYCTPPTLDFAHFILEDSVKIITEKAEKAGILPMMGQEDVDMVMEAFSPVDYYNKTQILPQASFTFHDAGHILGSAIVELEVLGKRIVFSGDLGNPPAPLLRAPDFIKRADYVIVESTYGDTIHEAPEKCKDLIENVIEDSITRGGVLMIPSFAMERTQQLLYHLNSLVENHRIPRVPVYIDSPLATRITEAYKKYPQYYNKETIFDIDSGDDVFNFPGLQFTHSSKESKEINDVAPPKIIIAGSGMSQGGRIVHHEQRYLSDEKNTLLVISYHAPGTLGRKIAEGAKEVEISDQVIPIRAKIEKITGYSAHADQRFLLKWLGQFEKICYGDECAGLKKIFVTQGESQASETLAGMVRDNLGIETVVPKDKEAFELE